MAAELVEALHVLQPFVYGGLFLVTLIQWRRRPAQAGAWLVATFGVLAAVVIAGQLLPEDSTQPARPGPLFPTSWSPAARSSSWTNLVLFPYFLYRVATSDPSDPVGERGRPSEEIA